MINFENSVLEVLKKLQTRGDAFIVGGYLRDKLLGLSPNDVDIVVSYSIETVKEIFPSLSWTEQGFEVGIGRMQKGKYLFEISSHPFETVEEILSKRDFSINTLIYDGEKLFDYHSSQNDIHSKIIKAVCPLDEFFNEKPQPYVRAIRLSAYLGFSLDTSLAELLKAKKEVFFDINVSRLQQEGYKIIDSNYPLVAFYYLSELGLIHTSNFPLEFTSFQEFKETPHLRLVCLANIVGYEAVEQFLDLFHLSHKLKEKVSYFCSLLKNNNFPKRANSLNQYIQLKQFQLKNDPIALQEFYGQFRAFMNEK